MANNFDSRELFRYVKIEQPLITDVSLRAKQSQTLRGVIEKPPSDQKIWARRFLDSNQRITCYSDLSYPYLDHLEIDELDPVSLPTVRDLQKVESFRKQNIKDDEAYRSDRERVLASVVAFRVMDMPEELSKAAKLLSFVDLFPKLADITQKRPYATPVFERMRFKISKPARKPFKKEKDEGAKRQNAMETLSKDVHFLWRVRNQMREKQSRDLEADIHKFQNTHFEYRLPKTKSKAVVKKAKASTERTPDPEKQKQHITFLKDRNRKLAQLRKQKREIEERTNMALVVTLDPKKLVEYSGGKSISEIRDTQKRVIETMKTYDIQYGKFCRVYEIAINESDREKNTDTRPIIVDQQCFVENPQIAFENNIRLLGLGNLIKVEEIFLGYKPAEISYIENILPGEIRKREVKSTKYFEQLQETTREETTDTEEETSTTTSQELSSEIESEINTRFNSDIDASVNASGGGSIGVVDLTGGASLNAGLGIGIDTSLSTTDKSDFSQEIVNKAVEKTKKSNIERRLTRSYSLYETTNLHEINNQNGGISKNGIYVFLDKKVCIQETTYGKRLFMLANIMLPGKNLLCEKLTKMHLNMMGQGHKPVFDISPEDIHPHNYRELVGRFRASHIKPPPSATVTIARTFKTDTTNANVEQQEFNVKKVADILVPFFERYKRYMITDTITIPEGYQAQEVIITVNHGSNGLSIPAHLPFSLAGATIYATPGMLAAIPYVGLTLPYVFWQIAYLASPLLHYNTDSSNVTASVANESHDSSYYFFPSDFLINEVFELLGNFSSLTPDILDSIKDKVTTLMTSLGESAVDFSSDLGTLIQSTVTSMMSQIQTVFSALQTLVNPANVADVPTNFDNLVEAIGNVTTTISQNYGQLLGTNFFAPVQIFFDEVLALISGELNSALAEMFEFFTNMFDNTQNLHFYAVSGMRGDIPVSLNSISIKPGVTVNLTACAVRTDEALDQWRLDTFSSLYQAYLQQMAEYENRLLTMTSSERITTSPGNMRREEQQAIKEIVLHILNNYHNDNDNDYTLDRIIFFENAIDWNNMSYRLYNYGPNLKEIKLDKIGVFKHVDDRRKAFFKAHWAQVMIPVHANQHLEAQVHQFFDNGTFDFEGEFTNDELTALYQNLILGREMIGDAESTHRRMTIPTDFVMLQDELPENDDHTC